jgi:hypothetical protein
MKIHLKMVPWQILVLLSKARVKVMLCGRRAGKTCALAGLIIDMSFKKVGAISHYVSPSYARSRAFHRLLKTIASPLISSSTIQPVPTIIWINGSVTTCRSFDRPDLLRGDASDLICLDEACQASKDDVDTVLRPMLSDRRGTLVLASTPLGYDWVNELWEKGQKGDKFIESWRFPTSAGPAFQSKEGKAELYMIKSQVPSVVYDQEYDAIPAANLARVFPKLDLDRCIISSPAPSGPNPNVRFSCGIDVGKVRDHGAIVVESSDYMIVHAERIPLNTPYEIQAKRAADVCRKWGAVCTIDATGGGAGGHALGPDAVIAIYRNLIPGVRELAWNTSSKEKMVQGLCVDIEQYRIQIPSQFQELLFEMSIYQYTLKIGGFYRYSAPKGQRDDLVSAFLMANLAVRNNWVGTGTGKSLAYAW